MKHIGVRPVKITNFAGPYIVPEIIAKHDIIVNIILKPILHLIVIHHNNESTSFQEQ